MGNGSTHDGPGDGARAIDPQRLRRLRLFGLVVGLAVIAAVLVLLAID